MDSKNPPRPRDLAVNRKTTRLGRTFAGSIGQRLDAHPGSGDAFRINEEKKIIALAQKTLSKREPDAWAMNFLTQAVEMHTKVHGFSQVIYDELYRLNEARATAEEEPRETTTRPRGAAVSNSSVGLPAAGRPDASRFQVNLDAPAKPKVKETLSAGKVNRVLRG